MNKRHYFAKLIPPRPTFALDMDDSERALMHEHAHYFGEHFKAGRVLVFGPVLAADGAYGMAILEAGDEAEARAMLERDPTVLAGLNRFEIAPMRVVAAARAKAD